MIGKHRALFNRVFRPLALPFVWLRAPPNAVSALALPLAAAAFYFILQRDYLSALLFVVLASLMDLLDGTVAEMLGKKSAFGNYFETMVDKFVEVIVLAGFSPLYPMLTALAIGLSMIASYAKPRAALVVKMDNRDWPAVGEHAERVLVVAVGLLAAGLEAAAWLVWPFPGFDVLESMLWLLILLTAVGSVQRILFGKKLIEEGEKTGKLLRYVKEGKRQTGG